MCSCAFAYVTIIIFYTLSLLHDEFSASTYTYLTTDINGKLPIPM